jgi:hypothetical protein
LVQEAWPSGPLVPLELQDQPVLPAKAVQVVAVDRAVMPYAIRSIPLIPVHREPLEVLVAPEAPVVLVAPLATGAMAAPSPRMAMEPWLLALLELALPEAMAPTAPPAIQALQVLTELRPWWIP